MIKKTKEFIALQNKWYKKLKQDGFEDIEFYNPKTGSGQSSPFMKTDRIPDTGQLRAAYSIELENHYRLSRNFLAHGPFYPNLKRKYLKFRKNGALYSFTNSKNDLDLQSFTPEQFRKAFRTFKAFHKAHDPYITRAQSKAWQLYCDGLTIREISDELRRLHSYKKLGKPPKRWGKATKGKPYSTFWVKTAIDRLKVDSIRFNATHSEGIDLWSGESAESGESILDFISSESLGSRES